MLKSIRLENVGPTPALALEFGSRLNIFTGDNGLGKSFLLDIVWFTLTRSWPAEVNPRITSGFPARLHTPGEPAKIHFSMKSDRIRSGEYTYREDAWVPKTGRPHMPGLVVYAHVDGSFSVWDPMKNYWQDDDRERRLLRTRAFVFSPRDVWQGLGTKTVRYCNGLLQDVYDWQKDADWKISIFNEILEILSPADCILRLGTPAKMSVMDTRNIPTLVMPYGEVSVQLASAGIRRILSLAYLLTWTLTEHDRNSKLLGKDPVRQVTFLMDEVEAHLHPQWQRKILNGLLAVSAKTLSSPLQIQYFLATHSPLVMTSLEPVFDAAADKWFDFELGADGAVYVTAETFEKKGDANQWLQSEAFDLDSTYSLETSAVMSRMRELINAPLVDPSAVKEQYQELLRVLPVNDTFLLRLQAVCAAKGIALI